MNEDLIRKWRKRNSHLASRSKSIASFEGRKTSAEGILEYEYFPTEFLAPPNNRMYQPTRFWYERNLEELLIGLGWRGLEDFTLWCNIVVWPPFRNLFYSEFPIAYYKAGKQYRMSICRVYQGRLEIDSCDKSHRVAILDIAEENPYEIAMASKTPKRPNLELLIEKTCPCFYDGEKDHEGTLFVYGWTSRDRTRWGRSKSAER